MTMAARRSRPRDENLRMDEIVDLCLKVSAGEVREVDEIAVTLARFWGQPFP